MVWYCLWRRVRTGLDAIAKGVATPDSALNEFVTGTVGDVRYFKLSDDVNIPNRWHLGTIETPGGHEPLLADGVRCDSVRLQGKISHQGRALDYCITSFGVPVARSSLAGAIEAIANRDIQRLPLNIPGHSGFEVVNAVRTMKCLDEVRSESTKWTAHDHRSDLVGQYRMVTNLKVVADALPGDAHVFRLDAWLVALIVSERVKESMEAAGCFGARFVDVT